MYTMNKIGPWPVVDANVSKITGSVGPSLTGYGTSIDVRLDTACLGSQSQAFTNVVNNFSTASSAAGDTAAYGVALQPIQNAVPNISKTSAIALDISMGAHQLDSSGNLVMLPFIGFLDGTSPSNGWHGTNNLCSDYVFIGDGQSMQAYDNCITLNTQVILTNLISGSLPLDKMVTVGFVQITKQSSSAVGLVQYNISARYCLRSLDTAYKGV